MNIVTDLEFTIEELETEEWRSIPEYAGQYSISALGRVRIDRAFHPTNVGKIMKLGRIWHKRRYRGVTLTKDGQAKTWPVHRLVALVFIGESNGLQVNHKDGNPANNRLSNLEYATPYQNTHHSLYVLGDISNRLGDSNIVRRHPEKQIRGEKCHTAVLTTDDVRAIRAAYAAKTLNQYQLAEKYNVTRGNIGYIVRGKTWKHVS